MNRQGLELIHIHTSRPRETLIQDLKRAPRLRADRPSGDSVVELPALLFLAATAIGIAALLAPPALIVAAAAATAAVTWSIRRHRRQAAPTSQEPTDRSQQSGSAELWHGNASTIDRNQLRDLLEAEEPLRLIMAQGPGRFHAAHIPGSETFASLDAALEALTVDEKIVVYCSGGHVSIQAQRWLQAHGYLNVVRYPGGLADWHAAGLPLAGGELLLGCS